MPPRSFEKRLIVIKDKKKLSYIREFNIKTRKVSWTTKRAKAKRLGPTEIALASIILRGKFDFSVTKESHLKVC